AGGGVGGRAASLGQGPGGDVPVPPQGPVLDVVIVEARPLLDGRVAPQTVYLGPTGQPDREAVAVLVAVHVGAELAHEERTLGPWPDQRHVAPEHGPQLGQVVEARAGQEPPARGRTPGPGLRPRRAAVVFPSK